MKSKIAITAGVGAMAISFGAGARAQAAPGALDFDAEISDAMRSAKRAAGFEFLGTLSRRCMAPPRRSRHR